MKLNRNDPCHCGSGKKYKKCCLPNEDQQSKEIKSVSKPKQTLSTLPNKSTKNNDGIVATMTGEYMQPVRLNYNVYDKQAIHSKIFKSMQCMSYDSSKNRWVWLFDYEAKNLKFDNTYKDIPKHLHPIVIGSFFSENDNEMYLDVKSHERALNAITFFDKYIPRDVAQLEDAIVLNRLIKQNEFELANDLDNFFKDILIEDKAKEFDDIMANSNSESDSDRLNLLTSIFEGFTDEIHDVERLRINYYEDGIDSFRMALKIKRIVAMSKFNGKEMTHFDIINMMSGNSPQ